MSLIRKIIFITLVLFLLFSFSRSFFDYKKNTQFYTDFKNQYFAEKKKNLELKTQFLKKNDPHEVEKNIRNKLNLSRPEEKTILIPDISPTPVPLTPTPAPVYLQWWEIFMKK